MASVLGAAGVKYNKLDVRKFGSQRWIVRIVTDTEGASTEDWVAGPVRADFKFTPSETKTEKEGEDGEKFNLGTETNYALEITTLQNDAASLLGLMRSLRGTTAHIIMELTPDAGGSDNVRSYASALVKPAGEPEVGAKTDPVFKFDCVKSTAVVDTIIASITMYSAQTHGFGATGTISLASGEYFDITEL